MNLPIVILAGGLATRLRPLTNSTPKSLINIAGKPFIVHQIEYLKSQNITDIIICIGYLGDKIEMLLGDGRSYGVNIKYSNDGDQLLGTGGALLKALKYVHNDFILIYGDSFLPINFNNVINYYLNSNSRALMTVYKNNNNLEISNVIFDGKIVKEYNKIINNTKMCYIDYGLSIFNKELFINFNYKLPYDLSSFISEISKLGFLIGYEIYDRYYEIGSHFGIKETSKYLEKRN
jgi:MurNAc alpha-1-phosphate uridylyltransferase